MPPYFFLSLMTEEPVLRILLLPSIDILPESQTSFNKQQNTKISYQPIIISKVQTKKPINVETARV